MQKTPRWNGYQKVDFVVSLCVLALILAGAFLLPAWTFFIWFVPLAIFWIRYNVVASRYD